MSSLPQTLHVSGNSIIQSSESEESIREDPRGILFMWEEPKSWAKYIMGCDSSVGITGWKRHLRVDEDKKTDNGAIEIFRVDALTMPLFKKDGSPDIDEYTKRQKFIHRDLQVAEFAAPVDAVEIAQVANVLGRIYAGNEGDQCEMILESYPGSGMLALQEMIRLGYGNMWMWERIADGVAEQTNAIGWHSTFQSQSILWTRSRRHLMQRKAKIVSPYLFKEYQDAVRDPNTGRAKAPEADGFHDDRMQAANMCYWAGHKWTYEAERTFEPVTEARVVDWQHRAPSLDDDYSNWRDAAAAMFDSLG